MRSIVGMSSFEILELFSASKDSQHIEFFTTQEQVDSIGIKGFVDLAQLYHFKLLMPTTVQDSLLLHFDKLDEKSSFHKESRGVEKYGVDSLFFTIKKDEQFTFLHHYMQALKFASIGTKKRVLNLGINRGDEFDIIKKMLGSELFNSIEFVGVDHSISAIEYAKERFCKDKTVSFYAHDINSISELNLGRFDLIISIGTLQSLDFNATFMSIYQNLLEKNGSIVLGFANCRWIDGEMVYGAKMPNNKQSDLSLVIKDIYFCKKYLQQKKHRVVISGKEYIFLSAKI